MDVVKITESTSKSKQEKKDLALKSKQDKKDSMLKSKQDKKDSMLKSKQEKKDSMLKSKQDKKDYMLKSKQEKKDSMLKSKQEKKDSMLKSKQDKKDSMLKSKQDKKDSMLKSKQDKKDEKCSKSDKEIELFKTIKISFKNIIHNELLLNNINDALIRTNTIIIRAYQFIKLYFIKCYDENIEFPVITIEFIKKVFVCICIKNKRGRVIKYNNDKFLTLYDEYFKFEKISKEHLSQILSYASISMNTAYSNSIKSIFISLFKQFINIMVIEEHKEEISKLNEKESKIYITKLIKEIGKFKNDILFNKEIEEENNIYLKYTNNIFPILKSKINEKNNHHYNLKQNPYEYLKGMFYMNIELEKINKKQFQILPLRTDIIPKYIDIDTKIIIELSDIKDKLKYLNDINNLKYEVWNKYFNMDNKVFNDKGKYKFNYHIQTDTIGTSVCFVQKIKKSEHSIIKKIEEFLYMEDFNKDEIKKLKDEYNFVYCDPGKNQLLYMMDDNQNKLRYTKNQRVHEIERRKYQNILEKMKKDENINEIEKKMSELNSKTCNFDKFIEYIKLKNEINEGLKSFYVDNIKHRKFKYRKYVNKQRSESKLLNNIKNKFTIGDKKPLLIYGSWNITKQQKNFISTPCIGIKRLINKQFKILTLDEYRTSCICNRDNTRIKNMRDKLTNKKIHPVLILTEKNADIGCINRDFNAVLNFKKLVDFYIINEDRPLIFKRGTIL